MIQHDTTSARRTQRSRGLTTPNYFLGRPRQTYCDRYSVVSQVVVGMMSRAEAAAIAQRAA